MKLIALLVLFAGHYAVADMLLVRTFISDDRVIAAMQVDNPRPSVAASGTWYVDPKIDQRHIQLGWPSTNDQTANLFCNMLGKKGAVTYEGNDRATTATAISRTLNAMPVTLKVSSPGIVDVRESSSTTAAQFIFTAIECTAL